MKRNLYIGSTLAALLVALGIGQGILEKKADAQATGNTIMVPRFEVDPTFPKPLPENWAIGAIGGMSIGADPIIGGVLVAAAARGREMCGFLVRKEPKGHGTNKYVEGPVVPGMKVVIIDDVVTTGGSALQSVDRIVEFGCEVVQVVGIVDRMEGGAKNFAERRLPFRSLLSITDFGIAPPT